MLPGRSRLPLSPFDGKVIRKRDAGTALEALYGALGECEGSRVGVSSGREIKVYAPVVFTVSLKKAGVEKVRVIAKARPGAQQV